MSRGDDLIMGKLPGDRLPRDGIPGGGPTGTVLAAALVAALGGGLGAAPAAVAASAIEEGRKIAFDRRKGNCMACHIMAGATLAGTVGPPPHRNEGAFPRQDEAARPDPDSTQINPQSLMPPFGRHEILTEDEIDKVVEYVHSL